MRKQRRFIVATALLVVLAVLYMSLQALPSTQTPHLTPGIAPGIAPDAPAASPRGADSSVDRDADKGNANSQSSFLSDSQSDRHRDMPAVPAARGQVAGLADFGQAPAAGAAAGVAAADAAADANVGDTGLRVMRTNRLHAFYYGWYKNPTTDGKWSHWNHQFIQHWDAKVAKKWPSGQHQPPDDVGADFFPILGPYSSADTETIRTHMAFLKRAGVGVLAVSWYPPGMADENGEPNEELIFRLFDEAAAAHLFVCLHIEPYEGRSAQTVLRDLQYLHDTFGGHAAMYRHKGKALVYVYDSYQIDAKQWAAALCNNPSPHRAQTWVIGLLVEAKHRKHVVSSCFDGFYTYFAADRFVFGSTWKQWPNLASFARQNHMIFIPSVGPGYIDVSVRPWNAQTTRQRTGTEYYDKAFTAALAVNPELVSITSFNEWHEGTQIEPAVPKNAMAANGKTRNYLDYGSDPFLFLKRTRFWAAKLQDKQQA
eukprot:m.156622 g.156622  ORF g.156622 m.156622 type:complete len:483 (+) comp17565_c0_seq4:167-1615(+)